MATPAPLRRACFWSNLRAAVNATPPPLDQKELCRKVREVYADLAQRPIERGCTQLTECCHFRLTGRTPYLTGAEALLAAKAFRATGRTQLPTAMPADGACPMLHPETGRCQIYADRPFGCRTHFCAAAGGPYSRREVVDLIHRLEDLSRTLPQADAQPLPAAVALALEQLSGRGSRKR